MQVNIVDNRSCKLNQLKTPCFVHLGKAYALVNINQNPMYKTPENKILVFSFDNQALMTFAPELVVLPAILNVLATISEEKNGQT